MVYKEEYQIEKNMDRIIGNRSINDYFSIYKQQIWYDY